MRTNSAAEAQRSLAGRQTRVNILCRTPPIESHVPPTCTIGKYTRASCLLHQALSADTLVWLVKYPERPLEW